jgi:GntR family transcriptional regulator
MLSLNYRDARPIYEQVKDGLRHLVVTGAIQAGDKLPSVRALASSLAINPNTIQRAYEALERGGLSLHRWSGRAPSAAERGGVTDQPSGGTPSCGQFDDRSVRSSYLIWGHTPEKLAAPGFGRPRKGDAGMIEVQKVVKTFEAPAQDGLTMTVPDRVHLRLVGPNGAGKVHHPCAITSPASTARTRARSWCAGDSRSTKIRPSRPAWPPSPT